jgi:hypothetical protein
MLSIQTDHEFVYLNVLKIGFFSLRRRAVKDVRRGDAANRRF